MLHFKEIWILYSPCSRRGRKIDSTGTSSGGKVPRVEAQVSLCDQTHCWGNKELGKVAFISVLRSQIWPAKRSYPSSSLFGHCRTVFMAEQNCWICIYFQYTCSMLGTGFFHRDAWSGSERTFSDINLECLGAVASGTAPTSVGKFCCPDSIQNHGPLLRENTIHSHYQKFQKYVLIGWMDSKKTL